MSNAIVAFFGKLTGNKACVAALLAVIPVTEIKGSVLYVVSAQGAVLLPVAAGYFASLMLAAALTFVVPLTLARAERFPIIKKATLLLTSRLSRQADRIVAAAERGKKPNGRFLFGVFAFVAIPLPLTGVWAGALLASILKMDNKSTFFALASGNFCAAGIVLTVALLAGEYASLVFDLFLVVVLVALITTITTSLLKRRKAQKG